MFKIIRQDHFGQVQAIHLGLRTPEEARAVLNDMQAAAAKKYGLVVAHRMGFEVVSGENGTVYRIRIAEASEPHDRGVDFRITTAGRKAMSAGR